MFKGDKNFLTLRSRRLCGERRIGFTLVELLVVMAVIIILVGMLFPVIIGMKTKAHKKQAQAEANTIYLAIKNYQMEFGKFPGQIQGVNDTTYFTNNYLVIQPLIGDNPRGKVFLYLQLRATNISDNTTNVFGQTDTFTNFIDPWGVPYVICQSEDGDQNCLISVSNIGYLNVYSVPTNYYYYIATNYSVPNKDVVVASFANKTNVSSFEVETWSGTY